MTYSPVSISNLAFGKLRGDKIEAFYPTERSPNARRAMQNYDPCRLALLEAFDWNCARKQDILAASSDAASADWGYRYDLPATCIAPRRIWNPVGDDSPAIPYSQMMHSNGVTKTLLTNMPDAELIYTFDQQAAEVFPPSFVTLLSFSMAAAMAYEVTGKESVQNRMIQLFANFSQSIPAADANQQVTKQEPDVDWIRLR